MGSLRIRHLRYQANCNPVVVIGGPKDLFRGRVCNVILFSLIFLLFWNCQPSEYKIVNAYCPASESRRGYDTNALPLNVRPV